MCTEDHVDVVDLLKQGAKECTRYISQLQLDSFLDRTLQSRVGMRVLAEQHINLSKTTDGFIGIISQDLKLASAVQQSWNVAKSMCESQYGEAPPLVIDGNLDATFSFIPVHLEYIMIELFKNSMRASIERQEHQDLENIPPVRVTICKGSTDITIRVSESRGVESHPKIEDKVWCYCFTTAEQAMSKDTGSLLSDAIVSNSVTEPMGWSWGSVLPQSKVYAEYFGGSLRLVSMHGHGTDIYLKLNHIGNVCEHLEV